MQGGAGQGVHMPKQSLSQVHCGSYRSSLVHVKAQFSGTLDSREVTPLGVSGVVVDVQASSPWTIAGLWQQLHCTSKCRSPSHLVRTAWLSALGV